MIKALPLILIGIVLYKLVEAIFKAGHAKGLEEAKKEVRKNGKRK